MADLAELTRERHKQLRNARVELEEAWSKIAAYVIPRRDHFFEQESAGPRRRRRVLDSVQTRSLELFASFLHSSVANPSSRWFVIRVREDAPRDLRQWAEASTGEVLRSLRSRRSNFYTALHEAYLDLGAFGTTILAVRVTAEDGVFVRHIPVSDVYLDEDPDGRVDFAVRIHQLTARQAQQRFPNARLGREIEEASKAGAQVTRFAFAHVVFSADDPDFGRYAPSGRAPFWSAWVRVEKGGKDADDVVDPPRPHPFFPYVVARWYRAKGDVYGRSPALSALGDILMLSEIKQTALDGARKLVEPPLLVSGGTLLSPVRLSPGGLTYMDGQGQITPLVPPGASRIELSYDLIARTQDAIREAFFVPLFVTPDSPVKTATQVIHQVDERNRATAPMVLRLQQELFEPLMERIVAGMLEVALLPPPPLAPGEAMNAHVEFTSPFLSSERLHDAASIARLFEALAPFAQVDPDVMDVFNGDGVARTLADAFIVPQRVLRSESDVAKRRKARADAQQQAAAAEQALAGTEAIKNVAQASKYAKG